MELQRLWPLGPAWRMRVVGYKAKYSFCNGLAVAMNVLDGLEVLENLKVLDGFEIYNDLELFDSLKVSNVLKALDGRKKLNSIQVLFSR